MASIQGYLNLVRWNIRYHHNILEKEWKDEKKQEQGKEPVNIFSNEKIENHVSEPDDAVRKMKLSGEDAERGSVSEELDLEEQKKRIVEREINIGRYRYNRIILEQSLPAFWEQRRLLIKSELEECRQRKQNGRSLLLSVDGLIALQTLDALRYWDLWQYIDASRSRTILEYLYGTEVDEDGSYCGDKNALKDCFIAYIKGIDSDGISKEERKFAAKLLMKHNPEGLDEIVHFISEQSIPMQWRFARSVVEIFVEDFSILQRKCLINETV